MEETTVIEETAENLPPADEQSENLDTAADPDEEELDEEDDEDDLDDEDEEDEEDKADDQAPEIIVANVNGTYVRFKNLESVPAGSKVYSSKDDLKSQTKDQLETLYSYVKKVDKKTVKDHAMAVENVWYAFQNLPFFDPEKHLPKDPNADAGKKKGAKAAGEKKGGEKKGGAKKDDKAGKSAEGGSDKSYVRKRDTNKYVMKAATDKSKKAVETMAPQARAIVELMVAGGKTEYTETELREMIEKNKEKLRTRQNSWRIFQYYRSQLISADVFVQK